MINVLVGILCVAAMALFFTFFAAIEELRTTWRRRWMKVYCINVTLVLALCFGIWAMGA